MNPEQIHQYPKNGEDSTPDEDPSAEPQPQTPDSNIEAPQGRDGTERPATSPAKQYERGEFGYDNPESQDYVAPGDAAGLLHSISESYFRTQPEKLTAITNRYNRLVQRDPELSDEEPRATIAIPIAIHNETLGTLRDTLTEIAAQQGIDQDEVWLYGNMPDTLSQIEKDEARAKLDALVAEFRETYPQLKLRSLAEEYDADSLTIARVRHDYMDLIAWDANRRNFRVDHPVIMLDADTRQMTKDALAKLSQTLTTPDSPHILAHTETGLLFDKEDGADEQDTMPEVRRLAMLQEIRRRQYWRIHNKERAKTSSKPINEDYRAAYNEEWGMAIALGSYLYVGGYNEKGIINENADLRVRMLRDDWGDSVLNFMRYAKPAIPEDAELNVINPFYYLVGTTIRSSGRRQEDLLRQWVAHDGSLDQRYANLTQNYIKEGFSYGDIANFGHTNELRNGNGGLGGAHTRDHAHSNLIIDSILKPSAVHIRHETTVPMPDPTLLLRRLNLSPPDNKTSDNQQDNLN